MFVDGFTFTQLETKKIFSHVIMDPTSCSTVSDEHLQDFTNSTISILRLPTRERLSCMLNAKKVIPSPENIPRDWRGLCTLLNYTIPSGCDPTDPIGKIFKFCEAKTTIAHFIQCLQRIDRYDVVEETEELIISDIKYCKEQCSLANPTPVVPNDFDINIITLDDINASNNGLPLSRYDAFLLYDKADIQSATAVVEKLETDYKLKLCLKDRDLRPGVMFEYQSIIKLISDRCNWLIIIVSNDFSNSPWNRFIMNYIQSLAIEQRLPKIIPCVFGDCILPQELKCYVHLFFNKKNPFCDPWNKLRITVSPYKNLALTNSVEISNSYQKLKIEEHTNPSTTIVERNEVIHFSSEEHDLMPKTKNVFDRFVKTVGNISIKVVPQKWSKKNKKKVKCTSL
ncbi:myeloid differentiation primary response protein MyD88 isoform X1 [Rhopalosiphum padi]|uniref:myeloid differentiation primary response protein MyD88 isoform X1 n=2 Tax=Rhopalosiphum padi TaxID=40932 RepID=UPI00298E054E|nr:myeloid differentiation primary response protein MyD88 isoform X1 [Rhopalosiphum padi]